MAKRKWLMFLAVKPDKPRRTKIVAVLHSKTAEHLGYIEWDGPWRQYVFYPDDGTYWANSCLVQIKEKIDELMAEKR